MQKRLWNQLIRCLWQRFCLNTKNPAISGVLVLFGTKEKRGVGRQLDYGSFTNPFDRTIRKDDRNVGLRWPEPAFGLEPTQFLVGRGGADKANPVFLAGFALHDVALSG